MLYGLSVMAAEKGDGQSPESPRRGASAASGSGLPATAGGYTTPAPKNRSTGIR